MQTKKVTYLENIKSKEWMDKNLKPQELSGFIRDAVKQRIDSIKNLPKGK